MDRQILVTVDPLEVRAAVLEDGTLAELLIERPLAQRMAGNIYKGRVENVLPGMEAAFVNIGYERNAFLYVGDAISRALPTVAEEGEVEPPETAAASEGAAAVEEAPASGKTRRPSIGEVVHEGQELVVQVAKEPVGTKGPRITTSLSLPGRYVVLVPTMNYVGVSRAGRRRRSPPTSAFSPACGRRSRNGRPRRRRRPSCTVTSASRSGSCGTS
jgi:ribonuclease G